MVEVRRTFNECVFKGKNGFLTCRFPSMNGPPLELHARLPGINEASPERFDASLHGGAVLSAVALGPLFLGYS